MSSKKDFFFLIFTESFRRVKLFCAWTFMPSCHMIFPYFLHLPTLRLPRVYTLEKEIAWDFFR